MIDDSGEPQPCGKRSFLAHVEVVEQGLLFLMRSKKHYEPPPSLAANGNHINLSTISNDKCKCTFTVIEYSTKKKRQRGRKKNPALVLICKVVSPLPPLARVRERN